MKKRFLSFFFAAVFCLVPCLAYAASSVPSLPAGVDSNLYVVIESSHDGDFYLYEFIPDSGNTSFSLVHNPTYGSIKCSGGTFSYNVYGYALSSGASSWALMGTYNGKTEYTLSLTGYSFVTSNTTINNTDGSVFFRPAGLLEEVLEMVKAQMPVLVQTVAGQMKILVACGVGLMALLICLRLFGKVLPIFRV